MYSSKSSNLPTKSSNEEMTIRTLFEMFLTEKNIKDHSERTLHDYNIHFDYLMHFMGKTF